MALDRKDFALLEALQENASQRLEDWRGWSIWRLRLCMTGCAGWSATASSRVGRSSWMRRAWDWVCLRLSASLRTGPAWNSRRVPARNPVH